MRQTRIAPIILLGIVAAVGSAQAVEQSHPVVAQRRLAMKAMAEAASTLASMFDGQRRHEATALRQAADVIESHAGSQLVDAFWTWSLISVRVKKGIISFLAGSAASNGKRSGGQTCFRMTACGQPSTHWRAIIA